MKTFGQEEQGSPGVKNQRVVVTQHGGPEVLQVVEEELPEPGVDEVRVKVLAAGVSAFDLIYRRWGRLPGSPRLPFSLGEDVVGAVDKLGERVSSLELGQNVAGATFSLGVGGGYTEFICLPEGELVPVPLGLDPAEAVCLVANYLTAHLHLHRIARVRSGERVLVHGAAGGVGTALLELGKLAGLEMYGTASKYNHELVSALGATPIDYHTEDFVERIRSLTSDGVDAVVDAMGWMPWSIPSAAQGCSGVRTEPCVKAGGWCGWAQPRRRRRDCGSACSVCRWCFYSGSFLTASRHL
jgi:NADPH2:quinone reductase